MDGPAVVKIEDHMYVGEVNNGIKHGVGRSIECAVEYIGQFNNGMKTGIGRATSIHGSITGSFFNDAPHLICAEKSQNKHGLTTFSYGIRHGWSHHNYGKLHLTFKYVNGSREGLAVMTDGHEDMLRFTYFHGRMTGFAMATQRRVVYSGYLFKGVKEGPGREICGITGKIYTGEFSRGARTGYGEESDPKSGSFFIGYWRNGLPHCKGLEKNKVGSFYFGDWANGIKNGEGYEY